MRMKIAKHSQAKTSCVLYCSKLFFRIHSKMHIIIIKISKKINFLNRLNITMNKSRNKPTRFIRKPIQAITYNCIIIRFFHSNNHAHPPTKNITFIFIQRKPRAHPPAEKTYKQNNEIIMCSALWSHRHLAS